MLLLMAGLVVLALGVLGFAAISRKTDFGRCAWPVAGLCVALAAVELSYRQGLHDGAKLAFYPPTLAAQQSQVLVYAAALAGVALIGLALAALRKPSEDRDRKLD